MYYQTILNDFITMSKNILQNNLTGIYLHGSMAMNCFNPDKSDIDLIIVIEHDISDIQKMDFMKQVVILNEKVTRKGLELSIVKREYCMPFVYPTPFELHFSSRHLTWFIDTPVNYIENMKGEDKDLAAHFTIINQYGVVLYGEQINNVFEEVPKKDYIDSIWFDVESAREDILEQPIYIVLNLCRVLAFLKEDLYLSKQKGGEWGLTHISNRYFSIISQALNCYKTNQSMQIDIELTKEFVDEMLITIRFEMELLEE